MRVCHTNQEEGPEFFPVSKPVFWNASISSLPSWLTDLASSPCRLGAIYITIDYYIIYVIILSIIVFMDQQLDNIGSGFFFGCS